MQNKTGRSKALLQLQGLLKKSPTYLSKVAVVLQDAPDKMLTFTQLMDRLAPLICEDRKSVERSISVCLSINKCFVKVRVAQASDKKRNYWKLDSSQITTKMVHRHFKGILQLFPELASKVGTENRSRPSERCSALHSPEPVACTAVQVRCEVKFSGPFSIESLLKRDGASARPRGAPPLSDVPVRAEQQQQPRPAHGPKKGGLSWDPEEPPLLLLQAAAGSSPVCSAGGSTHRGLAAPGAAKPTRRMHVCTEPSFPVYTRTAPYFTSPHSSYITYPVPAFTHDSLCFRL